VIFGIGTDIVAVERIAAALERHGPAFAERILSATEMAEFTANAHPARFLAKRFAAKEAFAKATGQGLRHPVGFQQMTVAHDELGKPLLQADVELQGHLARLGAGRCHLSISDEREMVAAFVVIESAN
jgi:holo-[acyl-carrier protein] synthase